MTADDGTMSKREHDENHSLAVKKAVQGVILLIAAAIYLVFFHHTFISVLLGAGAAAYAGWVLYCSAMVLWGLWWLRKDHAIRDQ